MESLFIDMIEEEEEKRIQAIVAPKPSPPIEESLQV